LNPSFVSKHQNFSISPLGRLVESERFSLVAEQGRLLTSLELLGIYRLGLAHLVWVLTACLMLMFPHLAWYLLVRRGLQSLG